MRDVFQEASWKICIVGGNSFAHAALSEEYVRTTYLPDHCKDITDQALELMQSF